MITKRTVLILGAGVSMPYGFPSGAELLRSIRQTCEKPSAQFSKSLKDNGLTPSDALSFASVLSRAGRKSIDAIVAHRRELELIAKVSIAACLLPCEKEDNLFSDPPGGIYQYLFERMNAKWDTFRENRLSIVTYNYDRSLEHYMVTSMSNLYGRSVEECGKLFKQTVPIVHMYGSLGELPGMGKTGSIQSYGGNRAKRGGAIMRAVRNLHMSYVLAPPGSVEGPYYHRNAEVICFLGFAYDERNLFRLFPTIAQVLELGRNAYGTAFGMQESERTWVKRYFARGIVLGKKNEGALQFLKKYGPLIEPPYYWVSPQEIAENEVDEGSLPF